MDNRKIILSISLITLLSVTSISLAGNGLITAGANSFAEEVIVTPFKDNISLGGGRLIRVTDQLLGQVIEFDELRGKLKGGKIAVRHVDIPLIFGILGLGQQLSNADGYRVRGVGQFDAFDAKALGFQGRYFLIPAEKLINASAQEKAAIFGNFNVFNEKREISGADSLDSRIRVLDFLIGEAKWSDDFATPGFHYERIGNRQVPITDGVIDTFIVRGNADQATLRVDPQDVREMIKLDDESGRKFGFAFYQDSKYGYTPVKLKVFLSGEGLQSLRQHKNLMNKYYLFLDKGKSVNPDAIAGIENAEIRLVVKQSRLGKVAG